MHTPATVMNSQNDTTNVASKVPPSAVGADDMIKLGNFDGKSILDNMSKRYNKDVIYTYIGTILLAVNPFKRIPIYGTTTTPAPVDVIMPLIHQ